MHSAVLSCELQTLGDTAKVLHEVAEHVTIKHEHLSVTVVMKSHLVSGSNIGDCRCCSLSPYKCCPKHMVWDCEWRLTAEWLGFLHQISVGGDSKP